MATPIGTNTVTAIARHHIMPDIPDMVYSQSPITFRLLKGNKRSVQGGTQIEQPWMYARMAAGGSYSGYDTLQVTPSDTIRSGAWDWKQTYVPVVIDGLTLIKTDSPLAIANHIKLMFEQANMEMAQIMSGQLWSAGTNAKDIDGLGLAIANSGTYAGLARGTFTWLKSFVDSTTGTLGHAMLNALFLGASKGGYHPTLIASRTDQWSRYWNLGYGTGYQFNMGPGAMDEQLYSAGFTNLLFNNVPWVIDDNVPDGPNSSNSAIFMLNERFLELVVSPRADFYLEPFQTPINQDAMVAKLLWAGNLLCTNPKLQGKASNVSA